MNMCVPGEKDDINNALPDERLSVLFVTPEFVSEGTPAGGLASYLDRASAGLLAMGHRPKILVASDRDEVDHWRGIPVFRVDVRSAKASRKIWNWLGLRRAGRIWSQAALLGERVKTLSTEMSIDIVQYASYQAVGLFRPSSVPALGRISSLQHLWDCARNLKPSRSTWIISQLERMALRRMDKVIGPSGHINEIAHRWIGSPVDTVETPFIPSVSFADPGTTVQALTAGRPYLLFFGTIGWVKGADRIGTAARSILTRHLEAMVVMVGKKIKQESDQILDEIRVKLGDLADRFVHVDHLDRMQLDPVIANARVVVLPSRIDNLPNACIEAMAAGRVVVATRGASFEQLIQDGYEGLLAEQCAEDVATKCLAAWELDAATREQIGRRAVARVERLSPAHVLPALVAAYRQTISLHRAKRPSQ